MTVTISGSGLTLDDVVRVARGGERVALAEEARRHMVRARAVVEEVLARGEEVYGLTTGVGTLKRVRVGERDESWFNLRLLDNCRRSPPSTPHQFAQHADFVRSVRSPIRIGGLRPAGGAAHEPIQ